MKRIAVVYGGIDYTVADRDLDDLRAEIAAAVSSGEPYWLLVNRGEGMPRDAHLLITAGTDLALVTVGEPEVPLELSAGTPLPPAAR